MRFSLLRKGHSPSPGARLGSGGWGIWGRGSQSQGLTGALDPGQAGETLGKGVRTLQWPQGPRGLVGIMI